MAAGNPVEAAADLLEEQPELDPLVAPDVRTGRAPGAEFLHGGRDDAFMILGLKRNDRQRHAGLLADRPRILEVFLPGTISKIGEFVFEPDLEIKSVNLLVPGLFHQKQSNRTVHPTRQ